MSQRANQWLIILAGVIGGSWLLIALVADAAVVVRENGWLQLPADPTFQHKIGELLVAVPLFLAAYFSNVRPAGWVSHFIRRSWPLTAVGGLLNLLAWVGTTERAPWTEPNRLWFMFLFFVGLAGPPLVRAFLSRRKDQFRRVV